MIFYLIYISKATELMNQTQLKELLFHSRKHNKDINITGLLLYVEGRFMENSGHQVSRKMSGRFIQILEGNESEVRELYQSIKRDLRHTHPLVLKEANIENRNFEEWEMGFCSTQIEEKDAGFADLENVFLDSGKNETFNRPLAFLASFYQMSKTKL